MRTVGDRLRWAIKEYGPRPRGRPGAEGSIRGFADAIGGKGLRGKGGSYGMIHRYLPKKGNRHHTVPPEDFLRAAADVLSNESRHVRWEWLATGAGEPTEEEGRARQATSDSWSDLLAEMRKAFGAGSERLDATEIRPVLLRTWYSVWRDGLVWPPREGPSDEDAKPQWQRTLDAIGKVALGKHAEPSWPTAAHYIGSALREPFDGLPLTPADLSDDDFYEYVSTVCSALRRLADAHRRRAEPITDHEEDSDGDA